MQASRCGRGAKHHSSSANSGSSSSSSITMSYSMRCWTITIKTIARFKSNGEEQRPQAPGTNLKLHSGEGPRAMWSAPKSAEYAQSAKRCGLQGDCKRRLFLMKDLAAVEGGGLARKF